MRKLRRALAEALKVFAKTVAVPTLVFTTILFYTPSLTPFPTTDFMFKAMLGSLAVALYFITVD